MKVSIITVVYNNIETIQDALNSVYNQDYSEIEYIVIDGGSTDGTKDLIKQDKGITQWISEPDNGLYDAMNKGMSLATGDIIGLLNSDDVYTSNHVISDIVSEVKRLNCDVIYADLNYVLREDVTKIVRSWQSGKFYSEYFLDGYVPAHPTVFITKKLSKSFQFNLSYKLAADYDFLLRLFHYPNVRIHYFPEKIINMRLGGVTSKNWKNIIKGNIEIAKSWMRNENKLPLLTLLYKRPRIKLKQFV
ncbi:MAG: glycosyltransferase family 2 protein [Cyclobacteriaceae bacterium]